MILKSFSKFLSLLIIFLFTTQIQSDEKIDIWKNKNLKTDNSLENTSDESPTNTDKNTNFLKSLNTNKKNQMRKYYLDKKYSQASYKEKVFF